MIDWHNLHALLIGVDHYEPNEMGFRSLFGCVNDVRAMGEWLLERGVRRERIEFLISPRSDAQLSEEERGYPLADFQGICAALSRLEQRVPVGDKIWIHFSGHGGRVTTQIPELKGRGNFDEALVPCDIAVGPSHYIRDNHIALLLHRLKHHGIIFFLDCCHSGGAVRHDDAFGVRGIDQEDLRTADLDPHEVQILTEAWLDSPGDSGWPGRLTNYVLVAACHKSQLAGEDYFEGQVFGNLTSQFLKHVRDDPNTSFRTLYEPLKAAVLDRKFNQLIQIQGDADWYFEQDPLPHGLSVYASKAGHVLLAAGSALGLSPGIQLCRPEQPGHPVATIVEDGGVACRARVLEPLEVGDSLLPMASAAPLPIFLDIEEGALSTQLAALIEVSPWLIQAEHGRLGIGYDDSGALIPFDKERCPLLSKGIEASAPDAAVLCRDWLEHLARYDAFKTVAHPGVDAILAGKITYRLYLAEPGYLPGGIWQAERWVEYPIGATLPAGRTVALRLWSSASRKLFLNFFCLSDDFEISRLMPSPGDLTTQSIQDNQPVTAFFGESDDGFETTRYHYRLLITTDPIDTLWPCQGALSDLYARVEGRQPDPKTFRNTHFSNKPNYTWWQEQFTLSFSQNVPEGVSP